MFDDLSLGHREAVKWGELVVGHLSDGPAVRRELERGRVDAVMHFAASAYVADSMRDPRRYYRNNLVGGLTLLDAMVDAGVTKLVFSSSCATFGLQRGGPIGETHVQEPINPYGETKLALERALRWYERPYGLRSVTLRYFNAAGADPDGEIGETHDPEPHLIPNVLRALAGKLPELEICGDDYETEDGTAVRDYVHVTDLASAHVLALEYLFREGSTSSFNLGTGHGYSVREIVQAAQQLAGREIPVRISPRRPGDPPTLVADGERARRELGWAPSHSDLRTILKTAWDWQRRLAEKRQ